MIQFLGVHKSFGDLQVLRGINLKVAKGEVVVICGPSGSGKSTLLRCINGLEPIQAGEVVVDDRSLQDPLTDLRRLRADVGMVFQSFNLYPHLTALENISLAPRKVLGLQPEEARARAEELRARLSTGRNPVQVLTISAAMRAGLTELLAALAPFARREPG